jgi:hypothetical protein
MGAMPYAGRTNAEACDEVLAGYRLEKPDKCPDSMYELMTECWNENPKQRPTMSQVGAKLSKIVDEKN